MPTTDVNPATDLDPEPNRVNMATAMLKLRGADIIEYTVRLDAQTYERPQDALNGFWMQRLEEVVADAQAVLASLKAALEQAQREGK
jgi:hypothetical protein